MKIKNIIICSACLLVLSSPAFSYIGEKYDYFYQDAISKLYKITPDTWEIKIQKSAEPYGYKRSSMTGVYISFKGRTKAKPLYPKRTSDYESFYLVIMPPSYSIENYESQYTNDPGPAMVSDKLLGETNGFKIFYKVTGAVEGEMPTWLNWKKDIRKILEIKE